MENNSVNMFAYRWQFSRVGRERPNVILQLFTYCKISIYFVGSLWSSEFYHWSSYGQAVGKN